MANWYHPKVNATVSIERMQRLLSLTRSNDAELYGWLVGGWLAIQRNDDPRCALGFTGCRGTRNRAAALAELANEIAPGRPCNAQAARLADAIARADYSDDDISRRIRLLSVYGRTPKTQRRLDTILRK